MMNWGNCKNQLQRCKIPSRNQSELYVSEHQDATFDIDRGRMVPDLLHVIPVRDNPVLDRIPFYQTERVMQSTTWHRPLLRTNYRSFVSFDGEVKLCSEFDEGDNTIFARS